MLVLALKSFELIFIIFVCMHAPIVKIMKAYQERRADVQQQSLGEAEAQDQLNKLKVFGVDFIGT